MGSAVKAEEVGKPLCSEENNVNQSLRIFFSTSPLNFLKCYLLPKTQMWDEDMKHIKYYVYMYVVK